MGKDGEGGWRRVIEVGAVVEWLSERKGRERRGGEGEERTGWVTVVLRVGGFESSRGEDFLFILLYFIFFLSPRHFDIVWAPALMEIVTPRSVLMPVNVYPDAHDFLLYFPLDRRRQYPVFELPHVLVRLLR